MSKSYEKKKDYKRAIKKLAKQGFINDPSGKFVQRGSRNSMERDYMPNR